MARLGTDTELPRLDRTHPWAMIDVEHVGMRPAKEYLTHPFVRGSCDPKFTGHHDHCHNPGWLGIAREYHIDARPLSPGLRPGRMWAGILNLIASFHIALECVCTPDCFLGCALAAVYTLLYFYLGHYLAVNMNWNIVSFAVIFPISQAIGMGFKRREMALTHFGDLLGNLRAIWGAVHTWKVKSDDGYFVRALDRFDDTEATQRDLAQLFEELLTGLIVYFDVPRTGRARHHTFGVQEQAEVLEIVAEQRLVIINCFSRIQRLIQELKELGLPGGEAHRLDQYISKVSIAFERLTYLKEYRTPQAFRSFARVYILLIGTLYGPYYVDLAMGASGTQANIGFALAFACSIQIVMSGLFSVMLGLEDPFWRRGTRTTERMDCIRVPDMVELTRQQLLSIARNATVPWKSSNKESL